MKTNTIKVLKEIGQEVKAGQVVKAGDKQYTVAEVMDVKNFDMMNHVWTVRGIEVQTVPSRKELSGK